MKNAVEFKEYHENPKGYILVQSITLVRIPLSILFAVVLLFTRASTLSLIVSTVLLAIIEATDTIDGKIARRYNLASEYGAALDPFADSLTRLIIFWSLAVESLVLPLVPLVMAVRDVTVSYSRIVLAKKNQTVSARLSGKIKAIVQATGAFLVLYGPVYWSFTGYWIFYTVSWIIIIVTILSAVEYIRDAARALR